MPALIRRLRMSHHGKKNGFKWLLCLAVCATGPRGHAEGEPAPSRPGGQRSTAVAGQPSSGQRAATPPAHVPAVSAAMPEGGVYVVPIAASGQPDIIRIPANSYVEAPDAEMEVEAPADPEPSADDATVFRTSQSPLQTATVIVVSASEGALPQVLQVPVGVSRVSAAHREEAASPSTGQRSKAAGAQSPQRRAPIRDERHAFSKDVKNYREKQRVNIVMQERDYSCGAAALATLLKYHWGDEVTETQVLLEVVRTLTAEELRERVQNGLSMTDLRRAAVRMNYQAIIGRLEFEKLKESKIPLVVGIVINDFDHFVVVRGVDDHYVYLADPARGNVRTPINEFKQQWQRNLVLVVVKEGVEPSRTSPLAVTEEEKSLGKLNRLYARDQLSAPAMTLPR